MSGRGVASVTTAKSHRRAGRIVFLGLFGSGNQGNDASLAAAVAAVRRADPAIPIACICPAPEWIAKRFGVEGVRFGAGSPRTAIGRGLNRALLDAPRRVVGLARALLSIRRDDVLFMPGTGILDDFGTGPLGVPLALFAWCLAAWLKGAKIAFVSVGAGPARHPVSRRLLLGAARLADYRSFRDADSRDFAASGGIDVSRDPIFPDIAFALPRPSHPAKRDERITIGLGVMGYYGWGVADEGARERHATYVARLADFAQRMLARGWRLRLYKGDDVDEASVGEVIAAVLRDRPEATEDDLRFERVEDLDALIERMGAVDLVVASRFHNLIGALMAGRPVVSLGYAAKNRSLLSDVDLGAFCQDIDDIDVDLLVRQVDALLADASARSAVINARVAAHGDALRRQERLIAGSLGYGGARVEAAEPAIARRRTGEERT